MTRRFFNFAELLSRLSNNDWETEPYLVVAGPPSSGKSALLRQFYADCLRQPSAYSLWVAGGDVTSEDQIARLAVLAGERDRAFPQTRTLLLSTASQVVVAASSFVNTDVAISVSGSSGSRLDRSFRTLLPVLLAELVNSTKPVFVIVDSEDCASAAVESFMNGICQAIAQGAPVRLIGARRAGPVDPVDVSRGVFDPAILRMHPLDEAQVREWAGTFGILLDERDGVHVNVSTDGWSGTVLQYFSKLEVNERWRALAGALR